MSMVINVSPNISQERISEISRISDFIESQLNGILVVFKGYLLNQLYKLDQSLHILVYSEIKVNTTK